jgi:hypothetical protein
MAVSLLVSRVAVLRMSAGARGECKFVVFYKNIDVQN